MKKVKKAESLVGIIVGVFILTIVVLSIGSLIGKSRELINDYDNYLAIEQLNNSSGFILNKLDISGISDGEKFYIYKNILAKKYELKIGNSNSEYKFISKDGNKINNLNEYREEIFIREFTIKKVQILGENKNTYTSNIKKYIK